MMADGDGHVRAVPQLPAEYDDLYLSKNSDRDFSLDINSRMTVPSRLSVGGKSLHDLEVDNKRLHEAVPNQTVSSMAIPNHITLTGEQDETPGIRESPFDVTPAAPSDIHITTPPRVLRADTDFPAVHEEEENLVVTTTNQEQFNEQLIQAMKEKSLGSDEIQSSSNSLTLDERIKRLEQREASRQTREMIFYPLLAAYCLYKLARWWWR